MGRLYYNTSRGSLAVTLRNGRTATLPGKCWTKIADEDAGSEDLLTAVRKGHLTYFDAGPEMVALVEPVVTEPVATETPEVAAPLADVEETKLAEGDQIPPRRRKGY